MEASRERVAPFDDLLKSHSGAKEALKKLLKYWLLKIGMESNVHMSVYSVKNGQVGPKSFAEWELMT